MGLIGGLVLPALHDREAVGTARFLQGAEFETSGLPAACVTKFFDEFDALPHCRRRNVDVGHGIVRTSAGLWSAGLGRRRRHHGYGDNDHNGGYPDRPLGARNAWMLEQRIANETRVANETHI